MSEPEQQSPEEWLSSLSSTVDWEQPETQLTFLQQLEEDVQTFDLQSEGWTPDHDVHQESRLRLMEELHRAGLLQEKQSEKKASFLQEHKLPGLLSFLEATKAHMAYQRSEERKAFLEEISVVEPLLSPISIDWFRFGPWVGGVVTPLEWASWGEHESTSWEQPTQSSYSFYSSGSVSETFVYRKDNPFFASLLQVGQPVEGTRAEQGQLEVFDPLSSQVQIDHLVAELSKQNDDLRALWMACVLSIHRLAEDESIDCWVQTATLSLAFSTHLSSLPKRTNQDFSLSKDEEENKKKLKQLLELVCSCYKHIFSSTPKGEEPPFLWEERESLLEEENLIFDEVPHLSFEEMLDVFGYSEHFFAAQGMLLSAEHRFALIEALANHQQMWCLPMLLKALVEEEREYLQRYILKRISAYADAPETKETLLALYESRQSDRLEPHFRFAMEAVDPTWQRTRAYPYADELELEEVAELCLHHHQESSALDVALYLYLHCLEQEPENPSLWFAIAHGFLLLGNVFRPLEMTKTSIACFHRGSKGDGVGMEAAYLYSNIEKRAKELGLSMELAWHGTAKQLLEQLRYTDKKLAQHVACLPTELRHSVLRCLAGFQQDWVLPTLLAALKVETDSTLLLALLHGVVPFGKQRSILRTLEKFHKSKKHEALEPDFGMLMDELDPSWATAMKKGFYQYPWWRFW